MLDQVQILAWRCNNILVSLSKVYHCSFFLNLIIFIIGLCLTAAKDDTVFFFRSPSNCRETLVKRIIGLPGDWIQNDDKSDAIKIPRGHCWVEGDNTACSLDSRSFGPVSYFELAYL